MSAMGFVIWSNLEATNTANSVPETSMQKRFCNHLQNVGATTYIFALQLSTFLFYNKHSDPEEDEKEHNIQKAMLAIRKRYGPNAIMKGSNLLDCSTFIERNGQIGGHKA